MEHDHEPPFLPFLVLLQRAWWLALLGILFWIPGVMLPEFGVKIPAAFCWEVRWLSMVVAGFAIVVPLLSGKWWSVCLIAILAASFGHNSVAAGERVLGPAIHIEDIAAALLVAAPLAGALQLVLAWRASRHARKDKGSDGWSAGYYQRRSQVQRWPAFPSEAPPTLRAAKSWLERQYLADESHNALHAGRQVCWPMAERLLNEFLEEHSGVAARLQDKICFAMTETEPVGSSFISQMLPYGSPRVRRLEKALHFTAAAAVAEWTGGEIEEKLELWRLGLGTV